MITNAIIIISIIIFIIINFVDKSDDKVSLAIKYGAFYMPRIEIKKEYWRFITANFVHIDILHIFMNVYCIYNLGHFFEYILGTGQYLYLILVTCIATSLACYYQGKHSVSSYNTVTLGASGIFYGYLGAMIALGLFVGGYFEYMLQQYLYIIVINIAFTLMNRQVSKAGHLGGLIGGFLAMMLLIWCMSWRF
ncbi:MULTISPECIES: rhomboid family intramembrane serine protease [unclassified Thomasclavelia]|uniref:Rhomboid family intramembrane serine protease n=1 Tax=Candidatus Erysipelatoclostridium merdavium TaxID=2838566 RepID=A0A9D2BMK7_9FIRM|nr:MULTISPECIES: rhomboid family intramembrane serine protease [unclassified Thomasclavelia]OUP76907.1 rhomboid family intramembrane serine protease [Erysipelatoclostridium sp. An173]OUQ07609.1 rhomboid family intramembrane serine protease [Erysipelatoclostridium sp. An15]HIX81641.1 rhomboid family intramembrane serine protease [Candidatus Erysipelatoclostridium merdavium]